MTSGLVRWFNFLLERLSIGTRQQTWTRRKKALLRTPDSRLKFRQLMTNTDQIATELQYNTARDSKTQAAEYCITFFNSLCKKKSKLNIIINGHCTQVPMGVQFEIVFVIVVGWAPKRCRQGRRREQMSRASDSAARRAVRLPKACCSRHRLSLRFRFRNPTFSFHGW